MNADKLKLRFVYLNKEIIHITIKRTINVLYCTSKHLQRWNINYHSHIQENRKEELIQILTKQYFLLLSFIYLPRREEVSIDSAIVN